MRTTLTPEQIAQVHTKGNAVDTHGPVNPYTMTCVKDLLRERGEDWAASVLLRSLERRARLFPQFPWLHANEVEILLLADEAEWALFRGEVDDAHP